MMMIPEEIMMMILSRLPIESLVRFRCVCKSWFLLLTGQVSDSFFTDLYVRQLSLANPNPILIHFPKNQEFYFVPNFYEQSCMNSPLDLTKPDWYSEELDDFWDDDGPRVTVYSISNGLVCIKSKNVHTSCLYVWNPITRDNVPIPSPPFITSEESFGFGYCQETRQYKVIRVVSLSGTKIASDTSDEKCQVNVFTLGTNTWRTLKDIPFNVHLDRHTIRCGALVNGALHWIAWEPESLYYEELISFDLETEVFKQIYTPDCILDEDDHASLCAKELRGQLAIFRRKYKGDLQIWVMQEYGVEDSWTKQFTIGNSQVPIPSYHLEPLYAANDGSVVLKNSKLLVSFNPETNSISIVTQIFGSDARSQTHIYQWSLVSPKYIQGLSHSLG